MIKGHLYLKYLKQSLIGFGISCFMVLGVNCVNSGYDDITVLSNGRYVDSPGDSNIQISVYGRGMLGSNQLGLTRRILAFRSTNQEDIYFWWNNGLPYFYYYYYNDNVKQQGYATTYQICNELSSGDTLVSNCTLQSITDSFVETVKPFFNSIKSTDLFGVNWGYYTLGTRKYYIRVCFSSHEYGKSVCFISTDGLAGSLDLPYPTIMGDISQSYIGDPPGWSTAGGGGGESISGGSYQGDYNTVTGNTVSIECSKDWALQWYRCNGYKSRMCYSSYSNNSDIYQGSGQAVGYALTGTDVLDVWFDSWDYRRNGLTGESMGYNEWFSYWRNTYNIYKKNPQHTNPFLGVPVSIFTLMGNVDAYGLPYTDSSILEFCDLALYTSNLNTEYTGVAYDAVCRQTSAIDILSCTTYNQNNPDSGIATPGQGADTPVGSSWDGVTNRPGFHLQSGEESTGNLNLIGDGKTFENNFFSLLTNSFKYPDTTGEGFLPSFIILTMCGLILFRFLSH